MCYCCRRPLQSVLKCWRPKPCPPAMAAAVCCPVLGADAEQGRGAAGGFAGSAAAAAAAAGAAAGGAPADTAPAAPAVHPIHFLYGHLHNSIRTELDNLSSWVLALEAHSELQDLEARLMHLKERYHFLEQVYKYHSSVEDEVVYPALDSKVKNVTSAYSVEHQDEVGQAGRCVALLSRRLLPAHVEAVVRWVCMPLTAVCCCKSWQLACAADVGCMRLCCCFTLPLPACPPVVVAGVPV